jgi:hypothetical protein
MNGALEKIAARLEALASAAADESHPIDLHEVNVCVVQILAQAEMLRAGILEHERAE